jgi:hypothetical protein
VAEVTGVKPLILLEADDIDLPEMDNAPHSEPVPEDDADPATPAETPPGDDPAPTEDPPADGETDPAAEADPDTEDDDDDGLGGGDTEQTDPVADRLRREQLYDAIVDVQQQCEQLSASAEILVDRIEDKTAKVFAVRSKKLLDDTISQCDVIRSRFADLGYERVRDIYATVRERVSAVAEIIKHVIDGDDDFRKTDSGNLRRNGSASEQGRGKNE